MNEIITWCNENSGFVSALLAFLSIILSILAIIVSINVAKLPYKKKVRVSHALNWGVTQTNSLIGLGISVFCLNVGNRMVKTDFVGLGFYKEGRLQKLYAFDRDLNCKKEILTSQSVEVVYYIDELIRIGKQVGDVTLYACSIDVEGTVSVKKFGTVEKILTLLSNN
ncbi:MAG: hypothetical protein IJY69_02815 [Clostridia bacterium]|nr:hypothetical protein [Clostridia bacterium]